MKNKPAWLSGIPLTVDVKKLEDSFGVPSKGTLVSYAEIADATGLAMKSNRYKSVLNAWRRSLFREHNLVTEGVRNVGILILDENRRVEHVERRIAGGARAIVRAHQIAAMTDEALCDAEHRASLAHDVAITSGVLAEGRRISQSWTAIPSKSPTIHELAGARKVWPEE